MLALLLPAFQTTDFCFVWKAPGNKTLYLPTSQAFSSALAVILLDRFSVGNLQLGSKMLHLPVFVPYAYNALEVTHKRAMTRTTKSQVMCS